ncbi:MAG: hypothetical protein EPO51_11665 [Phenylobacterium sp.]|uniref:hypothetical protein n=1 Tax=Phenylobacterium sp. TaxID=1871053 RepID=UPI00120C60F1|nr:hypothetical protein [Phenylobacterium sp.]TAJ71775.1 MAG: hypothetical protein EPO51_11665 [Phenylobacterium sp.]
MHRRDLLLLGVTAGLAPALRPAQAQGVWHKYVMRGQVVDRAGRTVTICVGRADGAEVGQTLTVVRFRSRGGFSKGAPPVIERRDVGEVRIASVTDDHYASGVVVSGRVAKRDMVELRAR